MDIELPTLLPSSRLLKRRKRQRLLLLIGGGLFFVVLFGFIQKSREILSPPPIVSLRVPHPDFTGRKDILKRLEKALLPGGWHLGSPHLIKVVNLCGMGGVGKSELALKFANHNLHKYSVVWLFHCESDEQMLEGYATLAERLGIPLEKNTPFELLKRKVHDHLEGMRDRPWLLIYDNVEREWKDEDMPYRGGSILITSRESSVRRNPEECLLVPFFSQREGIDLISRVTREDESQDMGALVELLHGYPLVVNQAAHLIRETPSIDVRRYLHEFQQGRDLVKVPISADHRYENTFEAVFQVTLEKLERECPLALDFLKVCSYFAPENIPVEWFEESEVFGGQTAEILRRLQHLSLVSYTRETRCFDLHRLLREALQTRQQRPIEQATKAIEILLQQATFHRNSLDMWVWGSVWYSHAINLLERMDQFSGLAEELLFQLYFKSAIWTYVSGQYRESIRYCNLALQYREISSRSACELFLILANDYEGILELDKGVESIHQAIKVAKTLEGKEDILLVECLSRLSSILNRQGQYDLALHIAEETLLLHLPLLDCYPLEVAYLLYQQAWLHFRLGNNDKTIELANQALSYLEKHGHKLSLDVAFLNECLGSAYSYAGEGEKAVAYSREGDRIRDKLYPELHPINYHKYCNWSEVLRVNGEYKKGLEYGKMGLGQEEYLINKQGNAFLYSNMGHCFLKLGQIDKAISFHEQALKKLIEFRGQFHLDIARGRRRLARALREAKRYEDAAIHLELAEGFLENTFPRGHPVLAATWKEKGATLLGLGKPQEGIAYCEKALAYWQEKYPGGHPQEAKTLQLMGNIYTALGDPEQAVFYHAKAVKVAYKKHRKGHPDLKEYVADFIASLPALDDLEWIQSEKENLLPIVKEVLGSLHPKVWKLAKL